MNETIKNGFIIGVLVFIITGVLTYFRKLIFKVIKNTYYKFIKKDKFDELLIYLYENKGHSVDLITIKKEFNLSEIKIINKIKKAENQGLVKNYPTFDKQYDWILTSKGEIYVENLSN